jgi:hypothetical protein
VPEHKATNPCRQCWCLWNRRLSMGIQAIKTLFQLLVAGFESGCLAMQHCGPQRQPVF